eukprot:9500960-Pyramimonas_sp.AAC.1
MQPYPCSKPLRSDKGRPLEGKRQGRRGRAATEVATDSTTGDLSTKGAQGERTARRGARRPFRRSARQ